MESKIKKCLILANGKPPKKKDILWLSEQGYNTLICADGGANFAYKMGFTPDYIIGDMDSLLPDVRKKYEKKSKIINYKRQNDTDIEKCLKVAVKNGFSETILLGATGGRLDHYFCNMGIPLKFSKSIHVRILHENSFLYVAEGNVQFQSRKGELISLYGFDKKTKITSSGLKYKLDKSTLKFGEKESTSNMAVSDEVKLKIKGGKIYLIRDFKEIKKLGFFSNS